MGVCLDDSSPKLWDTIIYIEGELAYIHIYIYMYICMYVCIHLCIHTLIYIYMYMYMVTPLLYLKDSRISVLNLINFNKECI